MVRFGFYGCYISFANSNKYLFIKLKVMYWERINCLTKQKILYLVKNKNLNRTGLKCRIPSPINNISKRRLKNHRK